MSCSFHLLFSRHCFSPCRVYLILFWRSQTVRCVSSRPSISRDLRESYRLLQLPEEAQSSPAQVKEAYLRLAKLYHPDAGAGTADAALFARVEEAYRAVLAHQSRIRSSDGERKEEVEEEKSRGSALQHRHYLSYDGVGLGTPSQRERQYRQIRVDRATEEVLGYRQREHERAAASEGALVERDIRQRSRKVKITQAVERLVEDLIQESMARGDFRNLSGAGKPLDKFQHNPYADPMTHNLNRILIDNGYQPPWVATQRDIREASAHIRHRLLEGRARLEDPASPTELHQWEQLCATIQEDLVKLNKMVDIYNLIVPMMSMQIVHFTLKREVERAERNAAQRRLELQRLREEERRRRKEEKKRANMASMVRSRKVGFVSWMLSFLQRSGR